MKGQKKKRKEEEERKKENMKRNMQYFSNVSDHRRDIRRNTPYDNTSTKASTSSRNVTPPMIQIENTIIKIQHTCCICGDYILYESMPYNIMSNKNTCSHVYCTKCLDAWIKNDPHKGCCRCAICRQPFTHIRTIIIYDKGIENVTNAIQLRKQYLHEKKIEKMREQREYARRIRHIERHETYTNRSPIIRIAMNPYHGVSSIEQQPNVTRHILIDLRHNL